MVMKLRNRLGRLEDILKANINSYNEAETRREYVRSWIANDSEGRERFKQFSDYCRKSGVPYDRAKGWMELTRTDPVAADLARKYLESYKTYVESNYGVKFE